MDLRRIRGVGTLALLLWLLWSKKSRRRGGTIIFHKVAAVHLRRLCRNQDLEALLVSHGGEGGGEDLLAIHASLLPAGLGGEGGNGRGASLCARTTRSRLVDGSHRLGINLSSASLPHHGGEKEVDLEADAS
jgi:hypothetical protein